MGFSAGLVLLKHTKLGEFGFLRGDVVEDLGSFNCPWGRRPIFHYSCFEIFNHCWENPRSKGAMANNRQIVNQRLTNPVTSTRFEQSVNSPMRIAATKLVHASRISPRAVVALENLQLDRGLPAIVRPAGAVPCQPHKRMPSIMEPTFRAV